MRIAILEDDAEQSALLTAWLESAEHSCYSYDNGASFVQNYAKESYDLIILDWMVPEMSGLEVLEHIRSSADSVVPILFVTQKDSEENIVAALERGADDYMCKPIKHKETIARINALMRRSGFEQNDEKKILEFAPFTVDTHQREITLSDEVISLTQKEYELMHFLFRNAGRIISRGHLLQVV